MRFVRVLTLSLFAALPLAAQQPTVVNQPTAEPLTARLNYTGYGLISFESNRPAFVALFDVTSGGLRQLYPESRYQAELATSFRYLSSPISRGFGGFRSPLFWNSMYGWSGYGFGGYIASPQWHTLLLVASSAPLKMGYAMSNELKISNALFRQGLGFRMDSDEGFSAIIKQISPTEGDAEITMDWLDVPPTMYPTYSMYGGLFYNAGNGGCTVGYGFLTGFQMNQNWCYANGGQRFIAQTPVGSAKPVTPTDTTLVKVNGGKLNGNSSGDGKAQSPEAIRRIVQQLVDAEGGDRSAIYKMGGATTATRGGYADDGTGRIVGGIGRARENGRTGFYAPSTTRVSETGPTPSIYHERTQTQSTRGGFSEEGRSSPGSSGASSGGSSARGGFSSPPPPAPAPAPVVAPTPSRPQVDPPHKPQ